MKACISFRADLAETRNNDELGRAQSWSKVNYLSPRVIDAIDRTPGNIIKPNFDANQANLLLPAYP